VNHDVPLFIAAIESAFDSVVNSRGSAYHAFAIFGGTSFEAVTEEVVSARLRLAGAETIPTNVCQRALITVIAFEDVVDILATVHRLAEIVSADVLVITFGMVWSMENRIHVFIADIEGTRHTVAVIGGCPCQAISVGGVTVLHPVAIKRIVAHFR